MGQIVELRTVENPGSPYSPSSTKTFSIHARTVQCKACGAGKEEEKVVALIFRDRELADDLRDYIEWWLKDKGRWTEGGCQPSR